MRRYPMSLSAGVKWVTGLVVLLLCATPVVVWRLSPGIRIGGPHGPAGPFAQGIASGHALGARDCVWSPGSLPEGHRGRGRGASCSAPGLAGGRLAPLPPGFRFRPAAPVSMGPVRTFGNGALRLLRLVLQEGGLPPLRHPHRPAGGGRDRREARRGLPGRAGPARRRAPLRGAPGQESSAWGNRRRQRQPDQLTDVLRAVDPVRPRHPARLARFVAGGELARRHVGDEREVECTPSSRPRAPRSR